MSKAEDKFELQLKALGVSDYVREHRFHDSRRWRFDFAWPELKLAVEIEGATYYGKNKNGTQRLGRHQQAKGMTEDCIKYGEAMLLGWRVYRCTQQLVNNGEAVRVAQILHDELSKADQ